MLIGLSILIAVASFAALLGWRASRLHADARRRATIRFRSAVVPWPALEARALADATAAPSKECSLEDVLAPRRTAAPAAPALEDVPRPERRDDDLGVIVGETFASVAPYAWKAATIDPAVFAAVSQLTHESVDSVGSLAAATEHWPGLRGWGASHGLLYKLRGHVGEWMAAEHLTDAGCEVAMAEASNWPGHDLWVDGHPVNVKVTSDAARVAAAALRSHPDVAVLVPGDAEHLPTDAIHFDADHPLPMSAFDGEAAVFVDDALSVSDATAATSDALDAASGHVDARLPWITIARSSVRELSLWNEGKTDLGRASKNVAIDAATIGGGAKAGAALGAKLGTLAGPGLGTAIGAAIGGVVGGLLGRTAARELREKPLREAREAFDRSREAYETAKSKLVENAIRAWDLRLASADAELARERRRIHSDVDAAIAAARDHVARATRLAAADRIELRTVAMRATAAELALATQHLERRSWLARMWPTERDAWARVSVPHLEAELNRLVGLERLAAEGPEQTFLDALLRTTQGRPLAEESARKNAQIRAASLRIIGQASERALRDLAARRIEMVRGLEAEHRDLLARTQRRIDEVAAPARAAREVLLSELRKSRGSVDETG